MDELVAVSEGLIVKEFKPLLEGMTEVVATCVPSAVDDTHAVPLGDTAADSVAGVADSVGDNELAGVADSFVEDEGRGVVDSFTDSDGIAVSDTVASSVGDTVAETDNVSCD